MEEQSHKDEMRAALAGDFERLQARLVKVSADDVAVPCPSTPEQALAPPPEVQRTWLGRILGVLES